MAITLINAVELGSVDIRLRIGFQAFLSLLSGALGDD